MTINALKHIAAGHYKKLKQSMDEMNSRKNAAAIHAFRVEYKKLRAFYRLLSSVSSVKEKIKMSSKLKALYAVCGEIRDLQNQQEQIASRTEKNKRASKDYMKTLKKGVKKKRPELKKLLSETSASSGKNKAFRQFPDELTQEDLRRFVNEQWTAISALASRRRVEDEHLHGIRKHLKDVYYSLKVYEGEQYDTLKKELLKKDEESLSALLDELGRFQDLNVSLLCLDMYWLNNFNLKEHQFLATVQYEWLKEHGSAHRRLLKDAKKMLPAKD